MALFFGDGAKTPLMDESMTAAMRRRISELWGIGLAALALLLAICLWSYDVGDPSPFSATSQPAMNWLGEPGAWIADTLIRHIGLGAWALVLLLAVWAARFLFHIGEYRIWARLIPIVPALTLTPIFASTHAVFDSWPLSRTGLGGMLGDAGARTMMELLPLPDITALVVLSLGLGALLIFIGGSALGFTPGEVRSLITWMAQSLGIVSRRTIQTGARAGSSGMRSARQAIRDWKSRPRSETMAPAEPTGNWRSRLPKMSGMPAMPKMPKVRMPSLKAEEPELSLERMTGADDFEPVESVHRWTPTVDEPRPGHMTAPRPDAQVSDNDAEDGKSTVDGASALRTVFDRLSSDGEPTAARPEPQAPAAGVSLSPGSAMPNPADALRPPVERERRIPRKSKQAEAERQPSLALDARKEPVFDPPALGLLQKPVNVVRSPTSDIALEENARMLETVLEDYGVRGEIVAVKPGPVVTLYELEPAPGLKASRVIGLSDDIARSMSALAARVSTVPGRSVIGIELPNTEREKVWIRDLFETRDYGDAHYPLALALGKDISGVPVVANLAKMPHLLIAGTTGSGKSVAINTMILSLLYRLTPKQCRLIMIDPKMLELSVYDNIPHLLSPVVTDPKKAIVALKWVVAEMEERYRKMSKMGVRNIDGYNARVRDAIEKGEDFSRTVQTGFDEATGEPVFETETFEPEEMPFIVVIVDEMADLMMVAGKEIEACIQRLAQMARASGIHLIMATQRPSVDVITGTIKANFPTRISFQVTSKIDSRTILGEQGAEQLLGQGDMLYMAGGGRIQRVHGPFVSDEEVEEVVRHLKLQGTPDYVNAVTEGVGEEAQALVDQKLGLAQPGDSGDELYDKAVAIVARDRKCSTSYIQRKLAIGYNKAARLVEQMEDQGVVTPANAVGKREILVEER
jgi:S-DNA-T family DNA segregation ATPase FtsK/SpoIIIE